MRNAEDLFRETAEKSLGLAVSIFTLTCEGDEMTDRTLIARELIHELDDPRYAGQALSFVCNLLSSHMTPEEVIAAKDATIEKAMQGLKHDG